MLYATDTIAVRSHNPTTHEATDKPWAFYKGIERVSRYQQVSATWFVLEGSERPIGALNPQVVPITPLFATGEEVAYFPKPRQQGPQRYPAKRPRQAPEGSAQAASANADHAA